MTIMSKIIIMRMGVPVATSIKSTAAPVPMTTIMRKAAPVGITMTGTPGASC